MTAIVIASQNHPLKLSYDSDEQDERAAAASLLSSLQQQQPATTDESPVENSAAVVENDDEDMKGYESSVEEPEEATAAPTGDASSSDASAAAALDQEITLQLLETEEDEDEPMADATTAVTASSGEYGGLSNLGNTCYMASALQMLASLDDFLGQLEIIEPEKEDDLRLRKAFLDVMKRLQSGETVRPEEFKEALDEKSPLFIGFRQQDSHEFLTTLLDLLDEDYKKKEEEEEEQEEKS